MKKILGIMVALAVGIVSIVFATVNDQTAGGVQPAAGGRTPIVMTGTADFTSANGTPLAASLDTTKVIKIPSNSVLKGIWYQVTSTASTASATINLGDGTTSNRFYTSASMHSTTAACQTNNDCALGILYTADGYIAVQAADGFGITGGVVKVKALIVPYYGN